MAEANADWPLDLSTHAGLEAQVAALADDIAYDNHDLDDGIRAGLFSLDDVAAAVPFVADTLKAVLARWPGVSARRRLVPELVRAQIGRMTDDLLETSQQGIAALAPRSVADVRNAGRALIALSPDMQAQTAALKAFLRQHMYRHPRVTALRDPSQQVVTAVFHALHGQPEALPADWRETLPALEPARARHIGDFVAGMTDRYALHIHERLIGPSPLPADVAL
jgi:dGTPase